jgi:CDP-diacylglycerol--glycerol-3-phosphate 3-phosphatidyltransferase
VANAITLSRIGILISIFVFLDNGALNGHLLALILSVLLIVLDGVDGIVARYFKEESEVGGMLDIAVDRIVENCFWIYFTARGILPVWIPMLVISRGFLTDGVRSVALAKGMTAFGEKTFQSQIGRVLVTSRASRALSGLSKVLSFLSLIIIHALPLSGSEAYISSEWRPIVISWGYGIVYLTVAYCILRGIPVIIESRVFLFPPKNIEY